MAKRLGFRREVRQLVLAASTVALLTVAASSQTRETIEPAADVQDAPTTSPQEDVQRSSELIARHREWLEIAAPLLSEEERAIFLSLQEEYRRDEFVERFWAVRDPFPETGANEFLDVWLARRAQALEEFETLEGDRATVFLFTGPPRFRESSPCPEALKPIEIWSYAGGRAGSFNIVFELAPRRGHADAYRLWQPSRGIESLTTNFGPTPGRDIGQGGGLLSDCSRARDLVAKLSRAIDWRANRQEISDVPAPSSEWAARLANRSMDLEPGTVPLTVDFTLSYPGRHQSRTVVQGLFLVPQDGLPAADDGTRRLVIDGDIVREDKLFERFRYRFDVAETDQESIPLSIERYLRPGLYRMIVRLTDEDTGNGFVASVDLDVPAISIGSSPDSSIGSSAASLAASRTTDNGTGAAGETAADSLFREANESISGNLTTVQLLPPAHRLHVGRMRVQATVRGEQVAKVGFLLNGKTTLKKTRPPYSVEIDLGNSPRFHEVAAVAYDATGAELARDTIKVNGGSNRFDIRLLEPKRDRLYSSSLRAHAEVEVPSGLALDRVELFLNETRFATLFQPPFVQAVELPSEDPGGEPIQYVRAVAFLEDGTATEDFVLVNAPDDVDRFDIQMVELYSTVVDRKGRPVEGMEETAFKILEDGLEQKLSRFQTVSDRPIHTGILLDASTSMIEELEEAERTALRFFERILTDRDRATVVTFNDLPQVVVPFSNDLEVLAGGLAELEADGETALYDSLIETLYLFAGLKGRRSLVLLTDGEDSSSQYDFDEALEYARQVGVALFPIGLELDSRQTQARAVLKRLADETGGEVFFISRAAELEKVYDRIEDQLRSQYLLTYQSTNTTADRSFRTIEVEVAEPGLEAKTLRGYYP